LLTASVDTEGAGVASAQLLFKSGFEGTTALAPLSMYANGAWQDINGTDSETGFTWPPRIWGGTGRFQLIAGDAELVTAATIGNYAYDQLRSTCLEAGADEFLDKRTQFDRLPAIVTKLRRPAP